MTSAMLNPLQPDDMTKPKNHLLKVFSGSHLGAEVALSDGEYLLGRDESCDIILSDQLIAEQHARLVLRGEECDCYPVGDAKVVVDGKAQPRAQLASFQYFTLGTTHLAVGPASSAWPDTPLPTWSVVDRAGPERDETHPNEGDASGPGTDSLATTEKEPDGQSTPITEPAAGRPAPPRTPGNSRARSRTWQPSLFALAAFVVLCLIGYQVVSTLTPPAAPAKEARPTVAQLTTIVQDAAPGESSGVRIEDRDGALAVLGHVKTQSIRTAIEKAVTTRDKKTSVRLTDNEGLVKAAQSVLRMNRVDVSVESGEPGEVIVLGEMRDAALWKKTSDQLRRLPRIGRLTERVVLGGKKQPAPASRSATKIAVHEAPPEPRPSPRNGEKEPDRREPAPAPGPGLVTQAAPAQNEPAEEADEERMRLPLRSLSIGNRRVMTMENGERVFVGATLKNGFLVKSIEEDRLVLVKDGLEKTVIIEKP